MHFDRRLARELAPFAAATLLGFALVPIGTEIDWAGYALAAGLTIAIGAVSLLVPWRGLPRATQLVPWLLFLVAIALLREASDGVAAGVGALSLVPVFWLALHGTRAQLLVMIAAVCAFFFASTLVAGDEKYTLSIWRIALMFSAASAIVGFAVQNLVVRVRSNAEAIGSRERDLEVAIGVVDRLRAAMPRGQSCSAGVARRQRGEAAEALLGRADEALYEAKRAGRNRSLIAEVGVS